MATNSSPKWVNGPQQFITAKDAAVFLGVSVDLIYDWIHDRTSGFPVKKFNATKQKTYRIPKQKFLIWVEKD